MPKDIHPEDGNCNVGKPSTWFIPKSQSYTGGERNHQVKSLPENATAVTKTITVSLHAYFLSHSVFNKLQVC
jgi:hypothetical protein